MKGELTLSVPARPPEVESWAELAVWLQRRIDAFRVDFEDDETAQSIGLNKQWMSRGRVAALRDVLAVIQPAYEAEAAELARVAAEDSIEQRFKDAGFGGEPTTALLDRLQDGDR